MTENRIRELLDELVVDVPRPDPAQVDRAWRVARGRRRAGSLLAAAAVASLVAGGAVTFGALRDDIEPLPGQRDPSPTSSPTPQPQTPPDTTYEGAPVWWAPPASADAQLDWLESRIPREVDLSSGLPSLETGERALALFTVYDREPSALDRLVVLTADGETRELEADHLGRNRDEDGNGGALTPFNGGVSPDGAHVAFAQPSSLELYDFGDGSWTTIDTPDWAAEGARWLSSEALWVPDVMGGELGTSYDVDGKVVATSVARADPNLGVSRDDTPYGIWVDARFALAGSYFLAGPVSRGPIANPEAIVARAQGRTSVLALGQEGRGKGCCPVVGWLSEGVVALETNGRVLAWTVGSDTLHRVAETTGLATRREYTSASWAWQSLSDEGAFGTRTAISSHCGVNSTWFNGELWLATPPLGDHNPPPGWDENETTGTFEVTGPGRAEFRSDNGPVARFRLAEPGAPDPNAGCE